MSDEGMINYQKENGKESIGGIEGIKKMEDERANIISKILARPEYKLKFNVPAFFLFLWCIGVLFFDVFGLDFFSNLFGFSKFIALIFLYLLINKEVITNA
jgi:hypothetical protein